MSEPLWPNGQRIEIIGLTGEFASGKSLFGLTIDPKNTLVYDAEKSCGTYESLGFTRVDMAAQMLKTHAQGYKPKDLFLRWLDSIRKLELGKFRVVGLDPASEIETGLCDWVRDNPKEFGHTATQYQTMSGLFWGDVKDYWKQILNDLAGRCETFYFTSHMREVWSGSRPTGKRQPKGKETLMELASLYLLMERKADAKGNVPAIPSAIVLKSRLALTGTKEGGEIGITPILPPRLPIATPSAIRKYMLSPPDYEKLKKAELAPEETMTADERLQMEVAKAEAEKESEMLKLERLHRTEQAADKAAERATARANGPKALAASASTTASSNGEQSNGKATPEQLQELASYKKELTEQGMTQDQWAAAVKKRGADKAVDLATAAAAELLSALGHRLNLTAMAKESAALESKSGT